jgi:type II secretory ATPase GspE/PulE/Tfp pilus assembly ATPase PilB-like protein
MERETESGSRSLSTQWGESLRQTINEGRDINLMAEKPASKNVRLALLSLLLSVLILTGGRPVDAAEIIYLKNGSSITGRIIQEESNDEFTVVDVFTGKTTIPTSQILRVVEGQQYVEARALGEAYKQRKQWIQAALSYQKALESTKDQHIRNECRKDIERISLEIIKELKAGNAQNFDFGQCLFVAQLSDNPSIVDQMNRTIEDSQQMYLRNLYEEGIKTAERDKQLNKALNIFRQIVANATGQPKFERMANYEISKIYTEMARPIYMSKSMAQKDEALSYLLKALDAEPDNDLAHFMVARIYQRKQLTDLLVEHLLKIKDSTELSDSQMQWVRRVLNRMLEIQARREKDTQQQVLAARESVQQRQRPGASETILEKVTGLFDSLNTALVTGDTGFIWKKVEPFVLGIGGLLAVYLFGFFLPYRIVRSHAARQPELKRDYIGLTRKTGLIGMFLYFGSILFKKKASVTCPHCGKGIDSPGLFEDWNFNRCPYCHKTIKAPYKLVDYIQVLAEKLAQERLAASGKKGGGATVSADSTLKLFRAIITYAVRMRASDVHIEAENPGDLLFRFRIDGVMHDAIRLPVSIHPLIVTAIKNMAQLDISERRVPQDGHFSMVVEKSEMNVRVATTPTRTGEKAVLRLLSPREGVLDLNEQGFSQEGLMKFERAVLTPHGILLSTGPTGSGKSTTLYAALTRLADGRKNIVTIEDPIEYEIVGVNQTQVNTKAGLTFGTAIRSILRQDPDVIMVGEIRDEETAKVACQAALTGHLVLSTLHTIDSSTALARLIDLGIDSKQLASAVVAIVAQRLVRKICPHCKKPYRPREDELQLLGLKREKVGENVRFHHGNGCEECQDTGYLGRTGIFEVLIVQSGKGMVQKALEAGATAVAIRDAARRDGMKTLREEGIQKVLEGITTVNEVLRVTKDDLTGAISYESTELEYL